MNSDKVVVHVMQCNRRDMVFDLFRERISQARKAPHLHPHCEVPTFHVAGADVFVPVQLEMEKAFPH